VSQPAKTRVISTAADLAHEIVRLVFVTILSEKMEAEKREDINEQDFAIVIEFTGLLLHVLDRLAFSLIPSNRSLFMDACAWNTWTFLVQELIDADETTRQEMSTQLLMDHNERQIEYAKYHWPIKGDQPTKGGLYLEFGKRLAKMQGEEEGFFDVTQKSLRAHILVQVMIENLNIIERLGEISRLTGKQRRVKGEETGGSHEQSNE